MKKKSQRVRVEGKTKTRILQGNANDDELFNMVHHYNCRDDREYRHSMKKRKYFGKDRYND